MSTRRNGDDFAVQVARNIPLVHSIVKSFKGRKGVEYSDLVQLGAMGLMQAIKSYQPERGALSTYASKCVRTSILRGIKDREVPTVRMGACDDQGGEEDWAPEMKRLLSENIDLYRSVMKKLMDILEPEEFIAICMRKGLLGDIHHSHPDIADVSDVTEAYVDRMMIEIAKKIEQDKELCAGIQTLTT